MGPPLDQHPFEDPPGVQRWEPGVCAEDTRRLWAAVIKQALKDALSEDLPVKTEARAWFFSDIQGIGSFVWICTILDFDPASIQGVLRRQLL